MGKFSFRNLKFSVICMGNSLLNGDHSAVYLPYRHAVGCERDSDTLYGSPFRDNS